MAHYAFLKFLPAEVYEQIQMWIKYFHVGNINRVTRFEQLSSCQKFGWCILLQFTMCPCRDTTTCFFSVCCSGEKEEGGKSAGGPYQGICRERSEGRERENIMLLPVKWEGGQSRMSPRATKRVGNSLLSPAFSFLHSVKNCRTCLFKLSFSRPNC